ncbi:MAG: Asp23/Gls24 family envelope stress response protein [Bacillota bacterium]|nr:Asp23/Gls24 family envelope stress response protein [Bacillota bacterium]
MAEINNFSSGAVHISEDVIGVIGSIAASEIKGVRELQGSFSDEMFEFIGKKNTGKGVEVVIDEEGVKVEIDIVVDYGVEIPAVARDVQKAVKAAIESMTAMNVKFVNVHVVAINFKTK